MKWRALLVEKDYRRIRSWGLSAIFYYRNWEMLGNNQYCKHVQPYHMTKVKMEIYCEVLTVDSC